jgi:hypothetical protein
MRASIRRKSPLIVAAWHGPERRRLAAVGRAASSHVSFAVASTAARRRRSKSRTPAKVDALMALCDQLEASRTRGRLLYALLAEALAPAEPAVLDMAG